MTIEDPVLCGIKQWTREDGEYRYIVLFFKTDTFSGTLTSSDEGEVFWIDKNDLKSYALADGFAGMFEVFDRDDLSEHYFWLEDGTWQVKNI